MQLSSDLDPCELIVLDPQQRPLGMSASLTLSSMLVDGFYFLIQILGFAFLCVFLLVFFLFGEDPSLVLGVLMPLVIFYMIFRLGVIFGFRSKRSRLLFKFQQFLQRCLQTAPQEIKVCLSRSQLDLLIANRQDNRDIRQTFTWDQVTALIEEQTDFRLQFPCLPELCLPKEQLPSEWQAALLNDLKDLQLIDQEEQ